MEQVKNTSNNNVIEWKEDNILEGLKAVLLFSSMDYVQKIKLDSGSNWYQQKGLVVNNKFLKKRGTKL